jgi:hypothetical protein
MKKRKKRKMKKITFQPSDYIVGKLLSAPGAEPLIYDTLATNRLLNN